MRVCALGFVGVLIRVLKTGTSMNTGIRNNDSTNININANMMIRICKNIMC